MLLIEFKLRESLHQNSSNFGFNAAPGNDNNLIVWILLLYNLIEFSGFFFFLH
jgi:hypothetical protein